MTLSSTKKERIQTIIETCLRTKFQNYKPESNNMPFHFRLLGKDRMALYSFIHSLNTSFGTSIFEPVAVALAEGIFKKALPQFTVGNTISTKAQEVIQSIINNLSMGATPNKGQDIDAIRVVAQKGNRNRLKTVKADIFLENTNGEIFLFDLKTVKPNISNFKDFKRTLLEWIAIVLLSNPQAKVHSLIAIPYNPYEPAPYERWTLKGMIDIEKELKVAEEFWDFLGGKGAYRDILDCFEKAGIELRPEIDSSFARFNKS